MLQDEDKYHLRLEHISSFLLYDTFSIENTRKIYTSEQLSNGIEKNQIQCKVQKH
jgi:hypothetical protein